MSETQVPAQPETLAVEVTNLDQFVKLLVDWHNAKVKVLEHLLQLPDATLDIQVGDDPSITLTGEILDGFKVGVQMALMELGSLPFVYETEPEEPTLCGNAQNDTANVPTIA